MNSIDITLTNIANISDQLKNSSDLITKYIHLQQTHYTNFLKINLPIYLGNGFDPNTSKNRLKEIWNKMDLEEKQSY